MKITQDVRDYAASQGIAAEKAAQQVAEAGMQAKAAAFRAGGQELYVEGTAPADGE
jgi:phosphomethylpyrimidine synthase